MHKMWRLSDAGPRNLGLAFTDNGVLLGHTSLIERHDGLFVVRARDEIEQLLKCGYDGEPPLDRLMSGLARVASALNANDQYLARIAAVHLQIPDLASPAVCDALAAEDALIKYARDEGAGAANWNPALHPRTGTPPNPVGSLRPVGQVTTGQTCAWEETIIRHDDRMHRLALPTTGFAYRPPNASTNSAIFSNGWPTPSRRTNRQSARKSTATGAASATFTH
jgi:hypothetical protein